MTGEKHQQAAGFIAEGLQHRLHDFRFNPFARLKGSPPVDRHRVHAPVAADHRRIAEQGRQALAFQGGGHQQDLQRRFVTQQLAAIEAQSQGQVGIKTALVELIEDDQTDAFQGRVVLQAAGEDALGDHLDTGAWANLAVQANAITDRLTHRLAQLAGQPFGRRAGRQAPRLKHQNALFAQPRLVQQRQRHPRGFTGAGRRFQHRFVALAQGGTQGGQNVING